MAVECSIATVRTTAIFGAFTALYLAWPSWDYYFDGLVMAGAVERVAAGGPVSLLFHPHHLLYCPIVALGYGALVGAGLGIRAWLFQQIVSAVCGVAVLVLFRRLARRLGALSGLADAGTVLLGSSYVFWHFSTQGDTTLASTLLQLIIVVMMAGEADRARGARGAAALGAVAALGFLVHQAAAVFVPAVVWVLWRTARRDRHRRVGAFLATSGAGVAVGYLGACVYGLGLRRPADMLGWARGYVGWDPLTGTTQHYGTVSASNVVLSARAVCEAFVGLVPEGGPLRLWGVGGAAAALVGAGAAALFASRRGPSASRRSFVEAVAIGLTAHALFFTYWSVGHARYWTMVLPEWILLATLGLTSAAPRLARRPAAGRRRAGAAAWATAAVVVAVVGTGPFRVETRPESNRWLGIAARLEAATAPSSLVLIAGTGDRNALKAYVPYFTGRNLMVLDWRFADKSVPPDLAVARLREYLAAAARERPVYALSEVTDGGLDAHFEQAHGVTAALRRSLFSPFRLVATADLEPGLRLLRLTPPN